ncbi:MAG: ABC transporter ATP-binding protein [Deltaproteobacteria bacterium]
MKALQAEGLGKGFRRYARPSDRLREWLGGAPRHETFWALRGVDIDLSAGAALGIVGDNGAGKSTLLAMLAGAVLPSEGTLAVAGRTSAILELGAGFHPEFSGRENLYLAAAAQGLSRDAVRAHEAELIAFAELGAFIDQPMRTYSSGMFLRLAFSIATVAEPDILVIDEALAVGDQRFQAKCLRRIEAFRAAGGTLVFCSHNLFQVKRLCASAIWLEGGRPRQAGPAARVCDAYADASRERRLDGEMGRVVDGGPVLVAIDHIELLDAAGRVATAFETGQALRVRVHVRRAPDAETEPGVAIGFVRSDGLVCHCFSTGEGGAAMRAGADGRFSVELEVPELPLLGGSYHLNVATTDNRNPLVLLDLQEGAVPFTITNPKTDWGVMRMDHRWQDIVEEA